MSKTRVLFVYTPGFFGSVWTVCRQLIGGLDPDRFDVHVAYNAAASGSIGLSPRPGLTLVPWTFGTAPAGATTSHRRRGLTTRARALRDAAVNTWGLAAYVRRHTIDVLHSNEEGYSAVLSAAVARLTGARLVIHYHTVPGIYGQTRRAMMRALGAMADLSVGVSRFVADALVAAGTPAERTTAVLNGIDTTQFTPDIDGSGIRRDYGIAPDVVLIVQSARIWKGKRQEDLVRALGLLRHRMPGLRCLIIGWEDPRYDGRYADYRTELRALAEELSVSDMLTIADARPEAAAIHAAADIVVLPSVDEPFGLVVAEAMATGKPVVGAASGGIPEIIVDGVTGFLVPACNPAALADRIAALANDSVFRARLGAAGRARVIAALGSERVGREFGLLYEAVRAGRRVARAGDRVASVGRAGASPAAPASRTDP